MYPQRDDNYFVSLRPLGMRENDRCAGFSCENEEHERQTV